MMITESLYLPIISVKRRIWWLKNVHTRNVCTNYYCRYKEYVIQTYMLIKIENTYLRT